MMMQFLVPQDQIQKHLHTLAHLAKLHHKQDFRDGHNAVVFRIKMQD
jgi:hypothetical protein